MVFVLVFLCFEIGRHGGLVVSASDSGLSSLGLSPDKGHYIHVLRQDTQVYIWVLANLILVVTLQ